jgi:class 3 adenylate cyclase
MPESVQMTARAIERRYYLTMAIPFAVDLVISAIFAAISAGPAVFARNFVIALLFLLLAGHLRARYLFRPIARFLATGEDFAGIERRLTQLPLRSGIFIAGAYLPAVVLRFAWVHIPLLAPADAAVAALLHPTWTDAVMTTLVSVLFIFIVVYFSVSAYLERLCLHLFETRGVNLGLFFGSFARKIGVALGFVAVAPLALIAADMLSYDGERLVLEVATDFGSSAFGLVITLVWVTRSLTRPVRRLDEGIGRVAAGDLATRLPVTSNEEIGQLTGRFNAMVEGLRDRERIRTTFGKYVSESVAAQLLAATGDGRLRGETREATLLFTDIEGFTTLSERLAPDVLIQVLNDYLELAMAPIQKHGGVVNAFIGDGLFASFNLPLPNEDHAACALAAALEIQAVTASHVFAGGVRLQTRIGVNTGTVIGGTVGAGDRLAYTLLGDAVNMAARLQELNKLHGTRILATAATCAAAGARFACRSIGDITLRGRSGAVQVFSVEAVSADEGAVAMHAVKG